MVEQLRCACEIATCEPGGRLITPCFAVVRCKRERGMRLRDRFVEPALV
jgi:hypothetical protein